MKAISLVLALSGIFALANKVYSSSQSIDALKYQFSSLRISKGNILNIKFNLNLKLINVSEVSLSFKSFTGDLIYEGSTIGLISMLTPITLAPRATSTVQVPISISNLTAINSLVSLLKNRKASPVFEIKGTMNVSSVLVPVSQKINLTA